jgi:hypothetical protein
VRLSLAILLALAACHDRDTEELTAIRDKMCACPTATCAEQELKRVPQRTMPSNPRLQAIAQDMMDCLGRLQAEGRPSTDPDAEAPAEPPSPPPTEPPPPTIAPPPKQ